MALLYSRNYNLLSDKNQSGHSHVQSHDTGHRNDFTIPHHLSHIKESLYFFMLPQTNLKQPPQKILKDCKYKMAATLLLLLGQWISELEKPWRGGQPSMSSTRAVICKYTIKLSLVPMVWSPRLCTSDNNKY